MALCSPCIYIEVGYVQQRPNRELLLRWAMAFGAGAEVNVRVLSLHCACLFPGHVEHGLVHCEPATGLLVVNLYAPSSPFPTQAASERNPISRDSNIPELRNIP